MSELNYRTSVLDSFLISTHRDLSLVAKSHADLLENDPIFYGHLAVWYMENGQVRDHKDVFLANLLTSAYDFHREAGFMLLQKFPLHQIVRALEFIKSQGKKTNKQIRKAVEILLKRLEFNDQLFDKIGVGSHKELANLYRWFRFRPSVRANKILFENDPPQDSVFFQVKALARAKDDLEQAEIIIKHKIPYTVAVGAIKKITPPVLVALINAMSAQELLNNMQSIKAHGAFNNPEVSKLVNDKLANVAKSKKSKVAALKVTHAKAGLDEQTLNSLSTVETSALKKLANIKKSTALFVDVSGSMAIAKELALVLGPAIATATSSDLFVYTTSSGATPIDVKGLKTLDEYRKAFAPIKIQGQTSLGAPFRMMVSRKEVVEQVLLITDQGENIGPYFTQELVQYSQKLNISMPNVVIVNVGRSSSLIEDQLRRQRIEVDVIQSHASADQYSIPNILALLSKGGKADLVVDIMSTKLPKRPKNLDVLWRPVTALQDATVDTQQSVSATA